MRDLTIDEIIRTSFLGTILRLNTFSAVRRFSSEKNFVLVQDVNDKALIVLNRPRSLNSLNKSLIKDFHDALKRIEHERTVLIIKSSNEKAYCVGGDLLTLLENARNNGRDGAETLMLLNASILMMSSYELPIVSFIDGMVFGGGVGISVFGKYQVATERTVLGMPETRIGFHPNSGGSYFFTRMKDHLGWYLGLTAQNLIGSDVVKAGLASHYCQSKNLPELEEKLLNCSDRNEVLNILNTVCENNLPEFSLGQVRDKIDRYFSARSVEEIISRLSNDGSEWALKTIEILRKLSPTSLKVTLRQLENGQRMTLKECLNMEFNLSSNFWKFHDVYEGVRATLIDKDHNPRWNPSSLSDVSNEFVERHFLPHPDVEEHMRIVEPLQDLQ
ncbi:hypothetical protein JTB14_022380 [Gonioctena quinquepunctata]|nr:hypothetical protein JTB14_022380 [Gonioctena quinquepunctata]